MMNEAIAGSLSRRRFAMVLLDSFAILALLMASLGLYGVISYLVERRTQELGIRIALGAQSWSVLRLVLTDGIKMAGFGVAVGLLASLGLTRLLAGLLYGVSRTDPLTFIVIAMLLLLVAGLCMQCGALPIAPGRASCERCLAKGRAAALVRYHAKRKSKPKRNAPTPAKSAPAAKKAAPKKTAAKKAAKKTPAKKAAKKAAKKTAKKSAAKSAKKKGKK